MIILPSEIHIEKQVGSELIYRMPSGTQNVSYQS